MRAMLSVLVVLLAACGGSGRTPGFCTPPGFTTCSENSMLTCVGMPGQDGGMTSFVDCTAMGLICIRDATGGSCGSPVMGQGCYVRNVLNCAADDRLMRCVWISEQPEPGFSGEIGVWRVQTDCPMQGQACPVATAACSSTP